MAMADYRHHENNVTNITNSNGTALAISMAQIKMDWSTNALQGAVGLGSFDDVDAISFGIGKRFGKVLLNGTIGREGKNYGYGFGVGFRF